MPLATVRELLAELAAAGEVVMCHLTRYEGTKTIEAWQCRVSGYVPAPAPERKPRWRKRAGGGRARRFLLLAAFDQAEDLVGRRASPHRSTRCIILRLTLNIRGNSYRLKEGSSRLGLVSFRRGRGLNPGGEFSIPIPGVRTKSWTT